MNSYILTDDGLALSVGMIPYNVDKSHPNYDNIVEAVKAEDWDSIPDLIDIAKAVQVFGEGNIEVDAERGIVLYEGQEMDLTLTDRLLRMMTEGFSVDPLINFIKNLFQNTSSRAINELYTFLDYGKMPITPDGHFLAYKRVRDDYRSMHDGKTDNSIGKIVEMPRNQVDDRSDNTCSHGLHFCSHAYLSNFSGDKVVVLKINPADVVSIPTDYNNTKGRACRYEVIGELTPDEVQKAMRGGLWSTPVIDQDDADRDFDDDQIDDPTLLDKNDTDGSEIDRMQGYDDGYQDGVQDHDSIDRDITRYHSNFKYREGYDEGNEDGLKHFNDAAALNQRHNGDDDHGSVPGFGDAPAINLGCEGKTVDDAYSCSYEAGYRQGQAGLPSCFDASFLLFSVNEAETIQAISFDICREKYNDGYEDGNFDREQNDASDIDDKHDDDYSSSADDRVYGYEIQTSSYIKSYNDGYRDGHDKDVFMLYTIDDLELYDLSSDIGQVVAGYVRGYKDGKNHKRKIKFDSLPIYDPINDDDVPF